MKGADFFQGWTILPRAAVIPPLSRARIYLLVDRFERFVAALVLSLLVTPSLASAHGERPQVVGVVLTGAAPNTPWVLTNNQGLFADIKDDFRWLCEDAVSPGSGVRGLAVYGALHQRMVAATTAGLFTSDDGGCEWRRAEGEAGSQRLVGLWQGDDPDDLVVASNHHLAPNDVFKSRDGGRTWTAAGLALPSPIHQVRRARSAPEHVYIQSQGRLWVSHDGADTFTPSPPLPGPARLLAVSPTTPNVLFAATEAIPETTVWRSADGGNTWIDVLDVADLDLRMTLHPNGQDAHLVGRVVGTLSSFDGGLTWGAGPALPPAVTLLDARPNGDLYLATDVYSGGPWVLGRSVDWGRTWTPVLSHFWDVSGRWDCGPLTRGHACCRGLCPGRPSGAECGQTGTPAPEGQCDQPPGVALGPPPDAGPRASVDMGEAAPADAGPEVVDARASTIVENAESESGGCQTSASGTSPWCPWAWLILLWRPKRLHFDGKRAPLSLKR